MPSDGDLALGRAQDGRHHPQRGGLAGAVRADEREDLALGDLEVDAAHRLELAIVLPKASYLKDWFRHLIPFASLVVRER